MVVPHGFCVNLSVYTYIKNTVTANNNCYFINAIAIFKVPSINLKIKSNQIKSNQQSNFTEVNVKSHRNRAILLSLSIMLVHGILEVKSPRRSGLSLSDVKP